MLRVRILPYSEERGQQVELWHDKERCVARLDIGLRDDAVGEQDFEKCARAVARRIDRAFKALNKTAK